MNAKANQQETKPQSKRQEPAEQLDEINANLRRKGKGPKGIQRTLEAQIEAKAQRNRSRDVPASAALGGVTKSS